MNKQEFEKLTGRVVSQEDFIEYERMYMEAGDDIDKQTFCDEIKKHGSSRLIDAYYNRVIDLKVMIANLNEDVNNAITEKYDQRKEMIDFLIDEAHEMSSMKTRNKAILLMGGRAPYLAEIMRRGYNLWEIDKTDLIEVLDNI